MEKINVLEEKTITNQENYDNLQNTLNEIKKKNISLQNEIYKKIREIDNLEKQKYQIEFENNKLQKINETYEIKQKKNYAETLKIEILLQIAKNENFKN